ncbi:MAG: hypothetical protein ABR499_08105 [Gemmatimonadaceae bacterium]
MPTLGPGRVDRFPRRLQISRFRRIVTVTLALSAIGALVGAVLGGLVLTGAFIAVGGWRGPGGFGGPFAAAAVFGGVLGFVLAPVAAWTLMRHVPLWRAIAETALGTVIGVVAGFLIGPWSRGVPWPILLALAGFAAAAIRLRLAHRGTQRAVSGSDAPSD